MDTQVEPQAEPQVEPWFSEGLRFKCTGCGQCCTGSPGYVYLSSVDLERLSTHFNLSQEEFTRKYARYVDGQYALLEDSKNYDCVFYKDKKCTVYESRPTQCRTFPWWVYHLREPSDWEAAASRCEGINHPDAPLVPSLHIQEQCLTYLDNLLDQNFDL